MTNPAAQLSDALFALGRAVSAASKVLDDALTELQVAELRRTLPDTLSGPARNAVARELVLLRREFLRRMGG